jgi:hypothetical protein
MTDDDTEDDSDDEPTDLYDRFTDADGRSTTHPHLEPDPERWKMVLQHRRFRDSVTQLDDLMCDYDHVIELHIGEEGFRDMNHHGERLPDELNFYIAEDREEFLAAINHRLFREIGTERFTVPKEANIGLAFGRDVYRDVIDVPEGFSHLDVKIPTQLAHSQRGLERGLEGLQHKFGEADAQSESEESPQDSQ